jgi:hypothetical protein
MPLQLQNAFNHGGNKRCGIEFAQFPAPCAPEAHFLSILLHHLLGKLLIVWDRLRTELGWSSTNNRTSGVELSLGDHPKAAIDDQVKSGHREKA